MKRGWTRLYFVMLMSLVAGIVPGTARGDLVAHWTFDSLDEQRIVRPLDDPPEEDFEVFYERSLKDSVSGVSDKIEGAYSEVVDGVSGKSLLLDGNTSFVIREDAKAPQVSGDFSVGAWIALGAYPTHWCPVVDHSRASGRGYFLGVNAWGHPGFQLFAGGKWHEISDNEQIGLRKWTHIAGVYTPDKGMILYVNGKPVAQLNVEGAFEPAQNAGLLIGRHSIKQKPEGTLRPHATEAVYTFYDGLVDEVRIYDNAISAADIAEYVASSKPAGNPPLQKRVLPSGPAGPGKFGAVYTTLKYYDAWDSLWRLADMADVVVRFDEMPGKFVFWHGTSYIPHWVTENGIWYDNEFTETWSELGCHEPMSDKRCEHSHVRIIESNDARVVVHWRYALVDNWYNIAKIDPLTGWGDWTDEVYTIYPDGVAVRKVTLHSSHPESPHEWHESIIVMGPGQQPETVLNPDALTLANMAGEMHVYSWAHGLPDKNAPWPKSANIHWVNTKSELKPFVIVRPQDNPTWDIYAGELRRDVSIFPWWNHWPAAQKPSDGRYAMAPDQASHSSLSHCRWNPCEETKTSMTKIMLNGLTPKSAAQLVPLAKSWATPPAVELTDGAAGHFKSMGYDPRERAHIFAAKDDADAAALTFTIKASPDSPVVNPAFIVIGWGPANVKATIDGSEVSPGKDLRVGRRDTVKGNDLIVWCKRETDRTMTINLSPVTSVE